MDAADFVVAEVDAVPPELMNKATAANLMFDLCRALVALRRGATHNTWLQKAARAVARKREQGGVESCMGAWMAKVRIHMRMARVTRRVTARLAPACGAPQPALSCGQPLLPAQPAAYWDQSRPVLACRSTGSAFLFYRYRHSF